MNAGALEGTNRRFVPGEANRVRLARRNPVSKGSRDFFCPNVFSKAKHGSNVSGSLAEILVQNESVRKTKQPVCNGIQGACKLAAGAI